MSRPDTARTARTARRAQGDEGAVIIEFAIVAPLIAVFLLGVIDFGNAYRYRNSLEMSVTGATRTNTQLARNRYADYESLRSLSSGLAIVGTPKRVIVWNATSANAPPANCLSINPIGLGKKGRPGSCNVYSPEQVTTSNPVGFPAGSSSNPLTPDLPPSTAPNCPTASWDANWCPWKRTNAIGSGDYLGMFVEIEYKSITGIIGSVTLTMSEQTIYRLEPPFIGS